MCLCLPEGCGCVCVYPEGCGCVCVYLRVVAVFVFTLGLCLCLSEGCGCVVFT